MYDQRITDSWFTISIRNKRRYDLVTSLFNYRRNDDFPLQMLNSTFTCRLRGYRWTDYRNVGDRSTEVLFELSFSSDITVKLIPEKYFFPLSILLYLVIQTRFNTSTCSRILSFFQIIFRNKIDKSNHFSVTRTDVSVWRYSTGALWV